MEGRVGNIINDDIINTVEAFLFANGNPVDIEDIAKNLICINMKCMRH
ncbi:hypothetical protein [Methanotorris igneus]|nr:hypothetical protein [Methanotorris igneus]